MENISSLLPKIEFIPADTLFDLPLKEAKEQMRCPKCGNKLKLPLGKNIALCRNPRKHRKDFIINKNKL